jgi:type II secretory pathway component PulK
VALGLVTVTLLFGQAVVLHFRGADNELAQAQARQAVEGGLRYAAYLLANLETSGELPAEDTYSAEEAPVGDGSFWFLSHSGETGAQRQRVFSLGDEAARMNLNTAAPEMLAGLPGMTPELAAAVVDWRDEDDDLTEGGAEAQFYQFLDPPYACKNAPFSSVEELRLVAGFTRELLYGEDANRNGLLDPNENDGDRSWPPDDQDGVLDEGVAEYLTVFTREPNTRPDGSKRINVTQGGQKLAALLAEAFGEERAKEIQQRVGQGPPVRSVLEFYARSGLTSEEFGQIDDALTDSDDDFLKGRINVNTASAVVLAALPGMDEQKAADLVAQRQGSNTLLDSVAWAADVLDAETIRAVGPYLTSRTFQVRADVAGVGRHGRGYARAVAVVDLTGDAPQIVYREDLTGLGWSLGEDTREQLLARRTLMP